MIRRVTRISPWQAGKFFAVLYFLIGLIFAVFFALVAQFAPPDQLGFGLGFAVAFPFLYAIGALIFVPIACLDIQPRGEARRRARLRGRRARYESGLSASMLGGPAGVKPAGRRSPDQRGSVRRSDA